MKLEYEGKCYVVLQTNVVHPITPFRHELLWYPERAMNLLDQVDYIPYISSIVTESAWLIGCYDREDVRVWREGEWRCPNHQTYGASVNNITMTILGIRQTISGMPLDGGQSIRAHKKDIEQQYQIIKEK